LGEALSSSLTGDYNTAEKILADAAQFIQARGEELSRQWYLSSAGRCALVVLVFGVTFWLLRDYLIPLVGKTFFISSIAMTTGVLGALLSIIMRMGEEKLDIHAGGDNPRIGRHLLLVFIFDDIVPNNYLHVNIFSVKSL
jgi:hypothetical protein